MTLTALLAPAAGAADIFNNGGINPTATTGSGIAAPFGTQWSELQNDGAGTANATIGWYAGGQVQWARLGDDFTLSSGATVREIAFFAFQPGLVCQTITGVNLRIWSGGPPNAGSTIIFGDHVTNRLSSVVNTRIMRTYSTTVPAVALPYADRMVYEIRALIETAPGVGLTLAPGTYWVDVGFTQNPDIALQSVVVPTVTVAGARNRPTDNARMSWNLGIAWEPVIDTGNPATGPDVPQDIPFIVRDAVSPPPSPCPADINGDSMVDVNDLLAVITTWGVCPGPADIFNNGGINPTGKTGSGSPAPVGTQWSELQNDGAGTANLGTGFGAGGTVRLADDFTLAAGTTVREIAFFAFQISQVCQTITGVNLRIWSGGAPNAGGTVIFGDTTTNRFSSSVNTGIMRTFSTTVPAVVLPQTTKMVYEIRALIETAPGVGLTLAPGTYWVDVGFTTGIGAATGTGVFVPTVTVAGARNRPTDNALQSTTSGTTWGPVIDPGNPAAGPDLPQDIPFIVRGAVSPPVSPCAADINGDSMVDVNDLLAVITNWGVCQ